MWFNRGFERWIARVDHRLEDINNILRFMARKEIHMSQELDELTVQVQENTNLEASAIVLIQGLADQIIASKEDPIKIKALSDQLKASAFSLAAAITANTPAVL